MTEVRVVIADDEPPARAVLRDLLLARDGVVLCAETGDGEATVAAVRTLRPDLVFLDIQMSDLDGFEVLTRLAPDPVPEVVFVTAYDELAVRAFEVHAVDYLVKPFTDERFEVALARARARISQQRSVETPEVARMLRVLDTAAGPAHSAAPPGHFMVRVGRRSVLVGVDEVDWIEADRYYATLHVRGEMHLVRETMASLEARLDPASFVRVHRSTIVNLRAVRELRRNPAGPLEVVLRDGARVEVSRSRRAAFVLWLSGRG